MHKKALNKQWTRVLPTQWPQRPEGPRPWVNCPRGCHPSPGVIYQPHGPGFCPLGGGSGDQHPTCARQLQKWAGVGCDLCCGALWLPCTPALGCCSLRVPQPWRRGQPPQPLVTTASSAILPTTSLRTCLAASTVVTPSARHACGGWTLQLMSSTGFSAHSAARAHPRPAEGWPCWTWT
jgi:hypothetical protein